jgi:hypothetical protein
VVRYCHSEAAAILQFRDQAIASGVALHMARYEDFTCSFEARKSLERFVGWNGGGDVAAHLADFGRGFEVERHGLSISGALRGREQRALGPEHHRLAAAIGQQCHDYQQQFGYAA